MGEIGNYLEEVEMLDDVDNDDDVDTEVDRGHAAK